MNTNSIFTQKPFMDYENTETGEKAK